MFVTGETSGRGEIHGDCSIETETGTQSREYLFHANTFADLETFVRLLYEQGRVRTNPSCGFHVHIRPRPEDLWVFATRHYWDGFLTAYHMKAEAYGRNGDGKYSGRESNGFSIALPWRGRRIIRALEEERAEYSAINLSSLVKHEYRTVEHRILPHQETADEAVASLRWMIDAINGLLGVERVPVSEYERGILVSQPLLWTDARRAGTEPETLLRERTCVCEPSPIMLPWGNPDRASWSE
jgi:hypothetical protein